MDAPHTTTNGVNVPQVTMADDTEGEQSDDEDSPEAVNGTEADKQSDQDDECAAKDTTATEERLSSRADGESLQQSGETRTDDSIVQKDSTVTSKNTTKDTTGDAAEKPARVLVVINRVISRLI
jgi:hypothetical protein